MTPAKPQQFDIVPHRVRGLRAPWLLILQHHDVPSSTLIVAPLTAPVHGDHDAIAPAVLVDGQAFRLRLLDMAAVRRDMLLPPVASASEMSDRITLALDIIFSGYPVGRPH